MAPKQRESFEVNRIGNAYKSSLKCKVRAFIDRAISIIIDNRRIGYILLVSSIILPLLNSCSTKTFNTNANSDRTALETSIEVSTQNEKPVVEEVQSLIPVPTIEDTPKEELEPLEVGFGIEAENFPIVKSRDVDDVMKYVADLGSQYPYQYFVYWEEKDYSCFYTGRLYKPEQMGTSFLSILQKGGELVVQEPDIFEKVMSSNSFSENSVEFFHQEVVLITTETGEDGIIRNGFFTYSKYGIALYIDEDNRENSKVWRGNEVNTDIPELRELFKQGYTQVRKIKGNYVGMFKIEDLPIRSS